MLDMSKCISWSRHFFPQSYIQSSTGTFFILSSFFLISRNLGDLPYWDGIMITYDQSKLLNVMLVF